MSPQTGHQKSSLQKAWQVRVSLVTGTGYQATGMVTKPKRWRPTQTTVVVV